jgi:hypothetical protein
MSRAVDGAADDGHTSRHQLTRIDESLVAQLIQFIDRNGVRWQTCQILCFGVLGPSQWDACVASRRVIDFE